MRFVDLIIKKKNNLELSSEEIKYIVDGYVSGEIPDYQMSSLLMAICFNGLSAREQTDLTFAMLRSGEEIDLSSLSGIKADKHSTGGVGDKTTLVVAPLVASCGLKMAKMSGRGLGHTGGTLDKLESIPGFKIDLSSKEFLKQVEEISVAVVGQTANITPADKKIYALRDVTGTVESVGLIAASIMSKKLASGASHILLDVKVGDGAFMKDLDEARTLAKAMVEIGRLSNRKTVAVLTDMDQPLGSAVGNALEVIEAIDTLKGNGPKDFQTLCVELASELLLMTDYMKTKEEAIKLINEKIANGDALNKLREMIVRQGGLDDVIDNYDLFPKAKHVVPIKSEKKGYINKIHTLDIGNAAMILGAGRSAKDEEIDMSVGIKVLKKVGDFVNVGDELATCYANDKSLNQSKIIVQGAFEIVSEKVRANKIVLDIIG